MKEQPERQIDDRIADWVDGQLVGRDRERFVAELRVNPQLRKDLEDYERTVVAVRAALQAPTVRTDVAGRVMAAIAAGRSTGEVRAGPARVHPLVWSLASAAALLVVALLINNWSAPTTVDQRAAIDDRREETARDVAQNPQPSLKVAAETDAQADPQAPEAAAGAGLLEGADQQPGANKKADADKDKGALQSNLHLGAAKEGDGKAAPAKPGAGGGEAPKAEAEKAAGTETNDTERRDTEAKPAEDVVVELRGGTGLPGDQPAHKRPDAPPPAAPTPPDLADGRGTAGPGSAGPGAPAAAAPAAPAGPAAKPEQAKSEQKVENELARRVLGGQPPPRTGGAQAPSGEAQVSVLPLVIIEGTVEATEKPAEPQRRGATEKSAGERKYGEPAPPLAQVDDFLRLQLSPPPVSKATREPVDPPPMELAGLPSLRLQRLPSVSFARDQETRSDKPATGSTLDTAAAGTAERVWLVEGSKEDVTQLLGRLSALTSSAKLSLRTGETADVVVPSPPADAANFRKQAEAGKQAAGAERTEAERNAVPPEASRTRIVLRFRTTPRR